MIIPKVKHAKFAKHQLKITQCKLLLAALTLLSLTACGGGAESAGETSATDTIVITVTETSPTDSSATDSPTSETPSVSTPTQTTAASHVSGSENTSETDNGSSSQTATEEISTETSAESAAGTSSGSVTGSSNEPSTESSTETSTESASENSSQIVTETNPETSGESAPETGPETDTPEDAVTDENPTVQAKSAPKGIFHSAGIIRDNVSKVTLVRSDIDGQDYISGTLVRVSWKVINPAEGVFDFSAIEKELAQADSLDSSIDLAVLDSKEMPEYVLAQCESFDYVFRGTDAVKTCLPWDSYYQQAKRELISRLGEQFDSHPNLKGIYFTYAAMTNGIEMHWRVDEADYSAVGYTPQKLVQAYNDVMDMYAEAFTQTSVIMEVHSVFNDSFLADNAFEHCYDKLGQRCGVAIWWCASRMATDPKEMEYKVYNVAQQATKLSFAVCQTVGSFVKSPERFDSGQGWTTEEAFRNEMDFFIGEGFKNFELWSADITDPTLIGIIKNEIEPLLE